ncbi:U1 zinc finger-domain-containing protein [Fennellomyces sp. T-0311]|nr:U1 zinc finger-domain-containing protein [Fennellomyces sp. T-0311]
MPKYYCEYCDIFLTHDSSSVRKAHNAGKNHIANVRNYYAEIGQDKAQAIIDEITKAYENSAAVLPPQYSGYPQGPPMGAPYGGPPSHFMGGRPPMPPPPHMMGRPPPPGYPPFPPPPGHPMHGMPPPPPGQRPPPPPPGQYGRPPPPGYYGGPPSQGPPPSSST